MASNERLQKFMARCGVDSRRKCEEYILQGRVRVNGQVVEHLGTVIDPDVDVVLVDGQRIEPQELVILAFHKPAGVLSAVTDATDRPTVVDLLPDLGVRLYPVGRLDWASEGLLLLSNDGELAHRVLHPRHGVEREYEVKCKGTLSPDVLERLRSGVELSDGPTRPARVSLIRKKACRAISGCASFWPKAATVSFAACAKPSAGSPAAAPGSYWRRCARGSRAWPLSLSQCSRKGIPATSAAGGKNRFIEKKEKKIKELTFFCKVSQKTMFQLDFIPKWFIHLEPRGIGARSSVG